MILVATAYAALFLVAMVDNMRGAAYPLILERFAISSADGSILFWPASLIYVLVTYNYSWLLQRWNEKRFE